jgi:hypothetical protein
MGKDVAVDRSEIMAVRRVVRQFSNETLQQCSSASSCTCIRPRIVMEEHHTRLHAFCSEWPFAVFLVFRSTPLTLVSVVPFCMNSTISPPFLSQKTVVISFLEDSCCLNLSACLVNVCASTFLTALWVQHSQMNPRFHHHLRCD